MIAHRRSSRRLASVALAGALLLAGTGAWGQIPPVPEDFSFVADYAGLLGPGDVARLAPLQREAFEKHDVPIIVVTIASMSRYGGGPIERLAYEWFNQWRIGTMDRPGGANKGMLLLVSTGDRRARIELGADWARRWDGPARSIMDGVIVPRFKSGDYPGGIVEGVRALGELAKNDPFSEPERSVLEGLTEREPLSELSPIPGGIAGLMIIVGIVLCGLSLVLPAYRKPLLIAGIGLIVAALVLWVVLAIVAVVLKRRGGGGGGGFASSGGFSGGFSGGGGASGSW